MKSLSTSMRARGFTIIEILIVLGILVTILGLGLFVTLGDFRRAGVREERDVLVALLTRARTHAMSNLYDSSHGLCLDTASGEYRVVRTDTGEREEYANKSGAITVTGIPTCDAPLVFAALSGTTTPTTITIAHGTESYTVITNVEGTILW